MLRPPDEHNFECSGSIALANIRSQQSTQSDNVSYVVFATSLETFELHHQNRREQGHRSLSRPLEPSFALFALVFQGNFPVFSNLSLFSEAESQQTRMQEGSSTFCYRADSFTRDIQQHLCNPKHALQGPASRQRQIHSCLCCWSTATMHTFLPELLE